MSNRKSYNFHTVLLQPNVWSVSNCYDAVMQNSQEDANIKYQSEKNEALLDRDQPKLLTLCTLAHN